MSPEPEVFKIEDETHAEAQAGSGCLSNRMLTQEVRMTKVSLMAVLACSASVGCGTPTGSPKSAASGHMPAAMPPTGESSEDSGEPPAATDDRMVCEPVASSQPIVLTPVRCVVLPEGLEVQVKLQNLAEVPVTLRLSPEAEPLQVFFSYCRDDVLLSAAGKGMSVSHWDGIRTVQPGAEAELFLALDPPDSGDLEVWVSLDGHAATATLAAHFQLLREQCEKESSSACPNPDGCTMTPAPECAFVPRRGCLAVSADVCQRSDVCETEGSCAFDGQTCTANRERDCARSSMCTYGGRCHLAKGECRALRPRDCEGPCRSGGYCHLQDGDCRARSDVDCQTSERCKTDRACWHDGAGGCTWRPK
jgi:hypothetical protein